MAISNKNNNRNIILPYAVAAYGLVHLGDLCV